MSWLSRLALKPAGRLQFVQDAPGIQIQQPKPQVTDTAPRFAFKVTVTSM